MSRREVEQAVLSKLLQDRDNIITVSEWIGPQDFTDMAHAMIYQAICDLYARRVPADYMTVADELSRHNRLDAVGGLSYLFSIFNCTPLDLSLSSLVSERGFFTAEREPRTKIGIDTVIRRYTELGDFSDTGIAVGT